MLKSNCRSKLRGPRLGVSSTTAFPAPTARTRRHGCRHAPRHFSLPVISPSVPPLRSARQQWPAHQGRPSPGYSHFLQGHSQMQARPGEVWHPVPLWWEAGGVQASGWKLSFQWWSPGGRAGDLTLWRQAEYGAEWEIQAGQRELPGLLSLPGWGLWEPNPVLVGQLRLEPSSAG